MFIRRKNLSEEYIEREYSQLHKKRFLERLISSKFDERHVFLDKMNTEWHIITKKLIDHLALSNLKILEIGCGYGSLSVHLAKMGARVTGIDISNESIELSRRNASLFNQKIKFFTSNAENLPFDNESFDMVICCDTIEHVQDYNSALNEMHRILKNEGLLLITWPNLLNPRGLFLKLTSNQPLENSFFYWTIPSLLKKRNFKLKNIISAEFFGEYSKKLRVIEKIIQNTPLKALGLRVGILASKTQFSPTKK